MKKLEVQVKQLDDRRFYYVDFGSEDHGRTSFRLWIHPSLLTRENEEKVYLEVPKKGVKLEQGKSQRTWILRKGQHTLFDIFVECGYRGGSSFTILTPVVQDVEYKVYDSPRGRLGVSYGALVTVEEDGVMYKWKRSGRTYGKPKEGLCKITLTEVIELDETDVCEIEDLAETE